MTISANVCVTISAGNEEEQNMTETIAYLREFHFASVVLPGVVSRKKQMVTPLLSAMEEEGTM